MILLEYPGGRLAQICPRLSSWPVSRLTREVDTAASEDGEHCHNLARHSVDGQFLRLAIPMSLPYIPFSFGPDINETTMRSSDHRSGGFSFILLAAFMRRQILCVLCGERRACLCPLSVCGPSSIMVPALRCFRILRGVPHALSP